ncbi:hypothetical protein E2C01_059631 [Portunus trituberculatus]|uniref:Uncharacterized protein n=1 Tax=Portunus trituberculatus TaxID=210409 RepID=A0A5B7H6E3_PORTR|nr:hypothetical protein [Portunus trituberculatus]
MVLLYPGANERGKGAEEKHNTWSSQAYVLPVRADRHTSQLPPPPHPDLTPLRSSVLLPSFYLTSSASPLPSNS